MIRSKRRTPPWALAAAGFTFTAFALAYIAVARANLLPGNFADDLIYLLMAEEFGQALFGRVSDAAAVWSWSPFPPLYPLVVALAGGHGDAFAVANLVSASSALAAAGLLFAWLRRLGCSTAAALPGATLWLALPDVLFVATSAMSEASYAALTLALLWRFDEHQRTRSASFWVGMALLAGATVSCREAGIALVAAMMTWGLIHHSRPALLAGFAALVPLLAWRALRPQAEQVRPGYVEAFVDRFDGASGAQISDYLFVDQLNGLWLGWRGFFPALDAVVFDAVAIVAAAAVAVALVNGLLARRLSAIYMLFYLGLIWIWPYRSHDTRFLMPVVPVAIGLIYQAWLTGPKPRWKRLGAIPVAAGLVICLACLPATFAVGVRFLTPLPETLSAAQGSKMWLANADSGHALHNVRAYALLFEFLQGLREPLRGTTCVYTTLPERVLHASRITAINPPRPSVDDATFHAGIENCELVLATYVDFHPVYPRGYPAERLVDFDMVLEAHAPWDERRVLLGRLYARSRPSDE